RNGLRCTGRDARSEARTQGASIAALSTRPRTPHRGEQRGPGGTRVFRWPLLEHELLGEGRAGFEPAESVRREVVLRRTVEDLLRERASHGRRLHEAVAGETTCRIDALGDASNDRMRIRGH